MGALKVYNQTTSQWEYAKAAATNTTLVTGVTLSADVSDTKKYVTPTPFAFISVYRNGVRLREGALNDYTLLDNNKVMFNAAPAAGSVITVDYGTQAEQMVSGSSSFVTGEWSVANTTTEFVTNNPYVPGSLEVFMNGLKLGNTFHYVETNPSTGIFTLTDPYETGTNLQVNYQQVVTTAGNADTVDGYHADGIMKKLYPVGTIYTNKAVSTNPSVLFGFGTWVALAGRVVVGLDPAQTEFDTVGETGGAKTHTLTTNEIPSHTHTLAAAGMATGASGNVDSNGFVAGGAAADRQGGYRGINNTGGGAAHNNLQPYVVAYMWERTA